MHGALGAAGVTTTCTAATQYWGRRCCSWSCGRSRGDRRSDKRRLLHGSPRRKLDRLSERDAALLQSETRWVFFEAHRTEVA